MRKDIGLIPLDDKELAMDSRDIAIICGKEHKNVLRDIRKMLDELAEPKNEPVNGLKNEPVDNRAKNGLVEKYERQYIDAHGEKRVYYLLPEVECLTLVSGYSVKLRSQIIKDWLRLRKRFAKIRQKSIAQRNTFTDTLKEHGYTKQHEYIQTTKQMKKELGITVPKTKMSERQLKFITASEYVADAMLDDEMGYSEVNPVCIEASKGVANMLVKHSVKVASPPLHQVLL